MLMRYSLSAVGGAAITVGLGLAMMHMIDAKFEAQEKLAAIQMDINPVVIEPPIIQTIERPDKFVQVETPPPPPTDRDFDRPQPDEPIATAPTAIPTIVKPTLDPADFVIAVTDRDAQPISRIEPNMPPRANKSGHCMMRFDVSTAGKPFNVMATYCSGDIFRRASIKAVQGWTYHPKIQNGQAIARKGVVTKMGFNLLDERGKPIPE